MKTNQIYRLNDGRFFHFRLWGPATGSQNAKKLVAIGSVATKETQQQLEKMFISKAKLNGNADGQLQFDGEGIVEEGTDDLQETGWELPWINVFALSEDFHEDDDEIVVGYSVAEFKVTEGSVGKEAVRIEGAEFPLASSGAVLGGENIWLVYLDWDEAKLAADDLSAKLKEAAKNN